MQSLNSSHNASHNNSGANSVIFEHTLVLNVTQNTQFVPVNIPGRNRKVYFKVYSITSSPFFLAILRKSQCEESDWRLVPKGLIVGAISTSTEPSDNDQVSYFIYVKSATKDSDEDMGAENVINIAFYTDLDAIDTGEDGSLNSDLPLTTKPPAPKTMSDHHKSHGEINIPDPLTVFKIGSFHVTKVHIIWALIIALSMLVYYFFIRPVGSRTVISNVSNTPALKVGDASTTGISSLNKQSVNVPTTTFSQNTIDNSSSSNSNSNSTGTVAKEANLYSKISPLLEPKVSPDKGTSLSLSPGAFTFSDVQQKKLKDLVDKIG